MKVRRFRASEYWGKPVPGFGDPAARLVLVGLAPGAHGANRTGRVFTGDRSGDFLYAALHRAGFANQPNSVSAEDGLKLSDAYVLTAVRCVPPGNTPRPDEIRRCAGWLERELALLPGAKLPCRFARENALAHDSGRVFLALGAIAWKAMIPRGLRPRPPFAHGAELHLEERGATLLGSYHVSQQNTQTGRLTEAMFDRVLSRARALISTKSH